MSKNYIETFVDDFYNHLELPVCPLIPKQIQRLKDRYFRDVLEDIQKTYEVSKVDPTEANVSGWYWAHSIWVVIDHYENGNLKPEEGYTKYEVRKEIDSVIKKIENLDKEVMSNEVFQTYLLHSGDGVDSYKQSRFYERLKALDDEARLIREFCTSVPMVPLRSRRARCIQGYIEQFYSDCNRLPKHKTIAALVQLHGFDAVAERDVADQVSPVKEKLKAEWIASWGSDKYFRLD